MNSPRITPEFPRRGTACGVNGLLIALTMLAISDAHAQTARTVYGPDGRVQSRITTDSQGSATVYGADGRVQGRTATDSAGTVTVYGADGRRTGTITPNRGTKP